MLTRTIIYFTVFVVGFLLFVKIGVIRYPQPSGSPDYLVKAQRYLYHDTVDAHTMVMAGTSLSTAYTMRQYGYNFVNLSMVGKSPLDGIEIIKRSGKIPDILLIETNLFDNPVDSGFVNDLFFPVATEIKKPLFFLQKEYKLHNLIPPWFYTQTQKVLGITATYSGLYSAQQNAALKQGVVHGNTEKKKAFINNKNISYHSTLNNVGQIESKYNLLSEQVKLLQQQGVTVIFFKTPVIAKIYDSERDKAKDSLITLLANKQNITYIKTADNYSYEPYLKSGDGIHLNKAGTEKYEGFMNASLNELLHP